MELNKKTCLRKEFAVMDSVELNSLLQAELQKDSCDIDDHKVCKILDELETRDTDRKYQDDAAIKRACDAYRDGCAGSAKAKKPTRNWILRVAAVAAIVGVLIIAVPVARGESNFLEFVTRIRDDVVAFFNPSQEDNRLEYEYQTDHPGLQQLYDAVAALGVTEDVVPMWIPEEYELVKVETQTFYSKVRVWACFESEENMMMFYYDLYGTVATYEYAKDEKPHDKYERAGIIHDIYVNNEKYTVLWEHDNLKCSIVVDCQEDQLTEILKSIYKWRMHN